jgi:hypothetical protein
MQPKIFIGINIPKSYWSFIFKVAMHQAPLNLRKPKVCSTLPHATVRTLTGAATEGFTVNG